MSVCHSVPISSMNDSRRLSYSEDLRQRGNDFYRAKSFTSAIFCYKNALYWASIASDDNRAIRFEIQGQIFANLSALHFQRKSYEEGFEIETQMQLQYKKAAIRRLYISNHTISSPSIAVTVCSTTKSSRVRLKT